jgi:uncharacterized protein YaaN involved in tellurite resistance
MKPTIIGNDVVGDGVPKSSPTVTKITPTIIGEAGASAQVKPTVIGGGGDVQDFAKDEQEVKRPENNFVQTPSAIPGFVRKRIPIKREEIKAKFLNLKDSVLDVVIRIIETTNQSEIDQVDVVTWGQDLQEKHNSLVTETLNLLGSEVVQKSTTYINRMMEILSSIRIEKVFENGPGIFAKILRTATPEIDTYSSLKDALREINQLSGLMRDCISSLVELSKSLERNSKTLAELGDNVEANLTAALVVADYFRQTLREDLAERLEDRATSLTLTLGQIRSGSFSRDNQIEQPMKMTTLIQRVVFNTLPIWMESVANLRRRHRSKQTNPTEIGETSRIHKSLQQQLRQQ